MERSQIEAGQISVARLIIQVLVSYVKGLEVYHVGKAEGLRAVKGKLTWSNLNLWKITLAPFREQTVRSWMRRKAAETAPMRDDEDLKYRSNSRNWKEIALKTYLGFKIGRTWWGSECEKWRGGEGIGDDWQNFGWISNTEKQLWGGWEKVNATWGAYETFGKIFQESN